jgi:hypothetical protein
VDVTAIRERLATRAATVIPRSHATLPDTINPPAAVVMPAPGVFIVDTTMDGARDLSFVLLVLVQKVIDRTSQDALDDYLSADDIRAALDAGTTADWDFAITLSARNYGEFVWGSGEGAQRYLGFEIPVTVGVS